MKRWVAVLDAFTRQDDWGVRELATALGISSTSVHRILHDLHEEGLLVTGAVPGRFRVGPELARLATLLAERFDLRAVARPVLEEAARTLGETVILAVYSPTRRAFWAIEAAEAPHAIGYVWESLRGWNDLVRGASGKGILAFLPEPEREAIIASVPANDRPALRRALDRARAAGFAVSHGERFAGAVGVAAPIHDALGRVVGDLIAGWPDNRTGPDKEARAAREVVQAARRISALLGARF